MAALGREGELADRLRHPRSDSSTVGGLPPSHQRLYLVRELFAHGHDAAATRLLTALLAEPGILAPDSSRATLRFQGELLYEGGRWREAQAILTRLHQLDPANTDYRGLLAVAAARSGDGSLAQRLDALLTASPQPYLHGRHLFWRARLAAVQGDRDGAVRLLQAAMQQGQALALPWDLFLHTDPDFRALQDYPPFTALTNPQR